MPILSLECSTTEGSCAIMDGGKLLESRTWSNQRSHGEVVIANVANCLSKASLNLADIEGIAVSVGPGRFTGIRVAINAAKSLAWAANKPVAVFNSLRVLAENAPEDHGQVITILNAFKNMVFYSCFTRSKDGLFLDQSPKAIPYQELENLVTTPTLCLGDGYLAYVDSFRDSFRSLLLRDPNLSDHPSAVSLARLGEQAFSLGQVSDWNGLKPLYIRASEAEERLSTGLLKPV